jgi:hypothetical protein
MRLMKRRRPGNSERAIMAAKDIPMARLTMVATPEMKRERKVTWRISGFSEKRRIKAFLNPSTIRSITYLT